MNRAAFLRLAAAGLGMTAGASLLAACGGAAGSPPPTATPTSPPTMPGSPSPSASAAASPSASTVPAYLAIAHGPDPAAITTAAVAAVGGMSRFVKKDADVIVKPNICVGYRSAAYAATTNPEVVATLVRLCLDAGARRVRVMDNPFGGTPQESYAMSGIGPAVQKAGGVMEIMSPVKFVNTRIPRGRSITSWSVYRDVLHCDTLINVPIAKTHSTTGLTLGLKNLMGTVVDRQGFHADINQRIADLASLVRPQLTVLDAYRILTAGGPTGGDLAAVRPVHAVAASHDVVAADAWAATLFGMKASQLPHIVAAHRMGLGAIDLRRLDVRRVRA